MKRIFTLMFIALSIGSYSQQKKANFKFSSTTITSSIQAPTEPHYTNEKCLSHQLDVNFSKNKTYRLARENAKNLIKQTIQAQSLNRAAPPVYSIPVVFHVIHKGEAVGSGTNISDAQLISAIDALNRDYRRTNGDGGIALGAGSDQEIEFCLATKDPSGNAHSGINRVDGTSVSGYASQGITTGGNHTQVKALSRWDNRYYLNVWVVSEINDQGSDVANINTFTGGTIGYAYLPVNPVTANFTLDGIVILNCSVGNDPTNSLGYRLWPATLTNRTLTHEVGHYLGLQHPFDNNVGCTETNCSTQGDEICDTPPTTGASTCASADCAGAIVENYMDYTGEACQNMFTAGQRTLMRGVLGGVRNALVNTTNCVPTSLTADFTANITTVTTGGTVSFTDLSSGGSITGWSWNFGGGGSPNTSSSQNPSITFSSPGTYTVSLTVSNGPINDNETKTSYITVSNYNPLICDTITNELPTDVLTAYGLGAGTWGTYPGHNSYIMDAYAEPFTVTSATEVQKVIMPIFEADYGSAGSTIDVVVYDDNAGEPGTALGSQTWLVSDLSAGYYNIVPFSTPVSVNGDFWVGVELNYGTGDTVVIGTATDRGATGDSTTYLRTGGSWYSTRQVFSNALSTSLFLDVLTSGSPSVNFTETSLNIAPGSTITFDASTTVNSSSILWDFVNGSPTSSSNTTELVTYNTLGTHDVTLYALGGCRVDSLKKQVVVSNTTSIALNELGASIKVFPNPVKDKLIVQFNELVKGNVTLDLMDANGRVVYNNFVPNAMNLTHTLDVNKIAKGIYQLRITNHTNTVIKKIIIH